MKNTIAVLLAFLLCGCASDQQNKTAQCETYRNLYATYQAVSQTRQPSKDEVMAATAAAAFLGMYCGWTAPAVPAGSRAPQPVDANGVPILIPPQ